MIVGHQYFSIWRKRSRLKEEKYENEAKKKIRDNGHWENTVRIEIRLHCMLVTDIFSCCSHVTKACQYGENNRRNGIETEEDKFFRSHKL